MDELELELKRGFLEESVQMLDGTEQEFLALVPNGDNKTTLDKIFRLAHNLKGTSRAVGFGQVAEFTHLMENLILRLKEGKLAVEEIAIGILLRCNDHIRNMINGLIENLEAQFDSADISQAIQDHLDGKNESVAPDVPPSEQNEVEALEKVASSDAWGSSEPVSHEVPKIEESVELKPMSMADNTAAAPMPEEKTAELTTSVESTKKVAPGANPVAKVKIEESIRVAMSRLERLSNFVGELVILQSVLQDQVAFPKDPLALSRTVDQLAKLSKEIHHISMSLRVLPVKGVLSKLQRIVRDTSQALGKKVDLKLIGEETEVDKTVIEHLSDPLVHIIRNAVDHGIEMPEMRASKGKSEVGSVTVHCFHEGDKLIIEIKDDGQGIDHERLRKKAIDKGIIRESQNYSKDELVNLIFHAGFSTKEQVTEVSGRGVGMDVVKTNIEGLSGRVTIRTEIGKGSTFRIELPLTMAVIDGMITGIGKDRFVIPLNQVHETLRLPASAIEKRTGVGWMVNLRGEVMPAYDVGQIIDKKREVPKPENQVAIIVRSSRGTYAALIDEIYSQQQVVIKQVGAELKSKKVFMGSSILGDGLPALILDLNEFGRNLLVAA